MNTVIDTLRFSERLQTSGFAADQANALARALADEMGEQLATKEDIKGVKKDIEGIEGEIKAIHLRIDGLETRLNFLFALIGLLVALELIPMVRAFTG